MKKQFSGTGLFAFYKVHPDHLYEVYTQAARQQLLRERINSDDEMSISKISRRISLMTDSDIGDKVFPHFIGRMLPSGVTGLLIAAIFAAAMSTVSTSLNSSATLLTTDWYQRFINRNAAEKCCMSALYLSTILWGLLGTGLSQPVNPCKMALH